MDLGPVPTFTVAYGPARAVGWLGLAVSDEDWQAALGGLRRDGRFTSEWMTTKRLERTAERAQVEQRRAQGAGYDERVSNLEVWAHISGAAREAAADSALAASVARATTAMYQFNLEGADDAMMKITAGSAVKQAMKEKNHGLDRLPVAPPQADLALQHVLGYVNPIVILAAARASPCRGVGFADDGGGGGGGELRLDAASRAALDRFGAAASAGSATAHTKDTMIILGKAPDERSMRRTVREPRGGDRPAVESGWQALRGWFCRSRRRGAASLCDSRAPP